MKVIKETTLHPEENDGVDLYPKTSINQVENLNKVINSLENSILLNTNNKLDKPATPTADSAVTISVGGTVGTKPLSEIGGGGGGGKIYSHFVVFTHSQVMFYSSRSTSYTFSDLEEYIKTFENGKFIAIAKIDDVLHGYLYNVYLQARQSGNIEVWYPTAFKIEYTSYKQENSLVSDVVTEI